MNNNKNQVILKKIEKKDNNIIYMYDVIGEWSKYFLTDTATSTYSFNLEKIPEHIAVIPFLCFMLPLSFVCDGEIVVNSIDKEFAESVDDIRKGYQEMYPQIRMLGTITYKDLVQNEIQNENKKSGLFFSGGADAFCSLLRHIDEMPTLISIWGADVKYDNYEGWKTVDSHLEKVGIEFGLNNSIIRSNFRELINEKLCNKLIRITNDGWWHGFYCGLPLIGHASILAFQLGLKKVYIASSFSKKVQGMYTCASDPIIDNKIHFCGCQIVHDAYEMERQEKIRYICEKSSEIGKEVELRVCWQSEDGKNCCKCEKCYRTIMEILSEGYDPNLYGFIWGKDNIQQLKKDMLNKIEIQDMNINSLWKPIVNKMALKRDKFIEYDWLIDMDWNDFNNKLQKKINRSIFVRGIKKMKRIIQRVN